MSRVAPWLQLLRPLNGLISLVGTVVGGLSVTGISSRGIEWEFLSLVLAGSATFLVTSGGNVLNDFLDVEGDRVNHPDRPLPRGEVSRESTRRFSVALFVGSVIPLLPLTPGLPWPASLPLTGFLLTLIIWASSALLLVVYEYRGKALGLPGNALVAYLTGAVFLFGGTVAGSPILALPWLLMAFFATLSREVVKDMEDAGGDENRDTLPRRRGMGAAALAARGAVAGAIALSFLPLLTWLSWRTTAGVLYLGVVLVSDFVFGLSVAWLPERLHREQGLSKLAMVFALMAFVGSALR